MKWVVCDCGGLVVVNDVLGVFAIGFVVIPDELAEYNWEWVHWWHCACVGVCVFVVVCECVFMFVGEIRIEGFFMGYVLIGAGVWVVSNVCFDEVLKPVGGVGVV